MRTYVTALFAEGGATIITPGGQALVQPDGDLVVILDPQAPSDPVEAWGRHVDEVIAWFDGLQRRLALTARRLGLAQVGVFGLLPLAVAWFADGSGEASAWAATAQAAAVGVAVVSILDTLLSRGRPWAESSPAGQASWWRRLRASPAYGAALSLAPALLAGGSALGHGSLVGGVLVVLGPALAFGATWVARRMLRGVLTGLPATSTA